MLYSFFDRDPCWWLPPAIQACVREGWGDEGGGERPGRFPSLIFHRSPIQLVQPEFSPRDYGTA